MATATIDTITDIKYVKREKNFDNYSYSIVKSNGGTEAIDELQFKAITLKNNFHMHLYQLWTQWNVKQSGTAWHNTRFVEKIRYLVKPNGAPKWKTKNWIVSRDAALEGSGAPLEGLPVGKLNNTQKQTVVDKLDETDSGGVQYRFPRKQVETWSILDHTVVPDKIPSGWMEQVQYTGVIRDGEGDLLAQAAGNNAVKDPNVWENPYDDWGIYRTWAVDEGSAQRIRMTTPSSVPIGTKIRFAVKTKDGIVKGDFDPKLPNDKTFEIEKTGDISTYDMGIKLDQNNSEGTEKVIFWPTPKLADNSDNPAHGVLGNTSFVINDKEPPVTTGWKLIGLTNNMTVGETDEIVVTLQTPDDVTSGTLNWEIKGVAKADIQFPGSLSGSFEVGGPVGSDSVTIKIKRDGITEGDETMKFKLVAGGSIDPGNTTLRQTTNITISDTSDDSDVVPNYDVVVDDGKFSFNGVEQSNTGWQLKKLREELTPGESFTRTFDVSDETMANHPLRFSVYADGHHPLSTHDDSTEWDYNVTRTGTPGQPGATVSIVIDEHSPALFYYCGNHPNMGSYFHHVPLIAGKLNKIKTLGDTLGNKNLTENQSYELRVVYSGGNWASTRPNASTDQTQGWSTYPVEFTGLAGGKKIWVTPEVEWLIDGMHQTDINGALPTADIAPSISTTSIGATLKIDNDDMTAGANPAGNNGATIGRTVGSKQYSVTIEADTGGGGGHDTSTNLQARGKVVNGYGMEFELSENGSDWYTHAQPNSQDQMNGVDQWFVYPPGETTTVRIDLSDSSFNSWPTAYTPWTGNDWSTAHVGFASHRGVGDLTSGNHNRWNEYTTNVTKSTEKPGTAGAFIEIEISQYTPSLGLHVFSSDATTKNAIAAQASGGQSPMWVLSKHYSVGTAWEWWIDGVKSTDNNLELVEGGSSKAILLRPPTNHVLKSAPDTDTPSGIPGGTLFDPATDFVYNFATTDGSFTATENGDPWAPAHDSTATTDGYGTWFYTGPEHGGLVNLDTNNTTDGTALSAHVVLPVGLKGNNGGLFMLDYNTANIPLLNITHSTASESDMFPSANYKFGSPTYLAYSDPSAYSYNDVLANPTVPAGGDWNQRFDEYTFTRKSAAAGDVWGTGAVDGNYPNSFYSQSAALNGSFTPTTWLQRDDTGEDVRIIYVSADKFNTSHQNFDSSTFDKTPVGEYWGVRQGGGQWLIQWRSVSITDGGISRLSEPDSTWDASAMPANWYVDPNISGDDINLYGAAYTPSGGGGGSGQTYDIETDFQNDVYNNNSYGTYTIFAMDPMNTNYSPSGFHPAIPNSLRKYRGSPVNPAFGDPHLAAAGYSGYPSTQKLPSGNTWRITMPWFTQTVFSGHMVDSMGDNSLANLFISRDKETVDETVHSSLASWVTEHAQTPSGSTHKTFHIDIDDTTPKLYWHVVTQSQWDNLTSNGKTQGSYWGVLHDPAGTEFPAF